MRGVWQESAGERGSGKEQVCSQQVWLTYNQETSCISEWSINKKTKEIYKETNTKIEGDRQRLCERERERACVRKANTKIDGESKRVYLCVYLLVCVSACLSFFLALLRVYFCVCLSPPLFLALIYLYSVAPAHKYNPIDT